MSCSICTHPKSREIDKAILRSETLRAIARQFSIEKDAVQRHKKAHLAEKFERALTRLDEQRELDLRTELARTFYRVNKLFDACDRELSDPAAPDRYTLECQAHEVVVYFEETKNGERVRKKTTLQKLLDRIAQADKKDDGVARTIELVESRRVDTRKLLLDVTRTLDRHMQTLGNLTGEFKQAQANPREINQRRYNELVDQFVSIYRTISPAIERRLVVETLAEMPETAGEFMPFIEAELADGGYLT